MIEEYLKLLGTVQKDLVTGWEGMVDSVSFDAYGCVQATVRPRMALDGKMGQARWFDVKRLVPMGERRILPVPPFVDMRAGDEIGAAEKPEREL